MAGGAAPRTSNALPVGPDAPGGPTVPRPLALRLLAVSAALPPPAVRPSPSPRPRLPAAAHARAPAATPGPAPETTQGRAPPGRRRHRPLRAGLRLQRRRRSATPAPAAATGSSATSTPPATSAPSTTRPCCSPQRRRPGHHRPRAPTCGHGRPREAGRHRRPAHRRLPVAARVGAAETRRGLLVGGPRATRRSCPARSTSTTSRPTAGTRSCCRACPPALLGHEGGFSPDGLTYYVGSLYGHTLTALDLTDPRVPHARLVHRRLPAARHVAQRGRPHPVHGRGPVRRHRAATRA